MNQPTFEPIGPMLVHVPRADPNAIVTVSGVPETVAKECNWGEIYDVIKKIGELIFGGGDGGDGCTEVTVQNPDGSSVKVRSCPKPKS